MGKRCLGGSFFGCKDTDGLSSNYLCSSCSGRKVSLDVCRFSEHFAFVGEKGCDICQNPSIKAKKFPFVYGWFHLIIFRSKTDAQSATERINSQRPIHYGLRTPEEVLDASNPWLKTGIPLRLNKHAHKLTPPTIPFEVARPQIPYFTTSSGLSRQQQPQFLRRYHHRKRGSAKPSAVNVAHIFQTFNVKFKNHRKSKCCLSDGEIIWEQKALQPVNKKPRLVLAEKQEIKDLTAQCATSTNANSITQGDCNVETICRHFPVTNLTTAAAATGHLLGDAREFEGNRELFEKDSLIEGQHRDVLADISPLLCSEISPFGPFDAAANYLDSGILEMNFSHLSTSHQISGDDSCCITRVRNSSETSASHAANSQRTNTDLKDTLKVSVDFTLLSTPQSSPESNSQEEFSPICLNGQQHTAHTMAVDRSQNLDCSSW